MRPEFPEEFFDSDADIETVPEIDSSAESGESLIYIGFNSRVVALDRDSGRMIWEWQSPEGSGFVAVLLDGDRLFASVLGYTYCLDAQTGECLWSNALKGMGVGIPCLASNHHSTLIWSSLAQLHEEQVAMQQQQMNQQPQG